MPPVLRVWVALLACLLLALPAISGGGGGGGGDSTGVWILPRSSQLGSMPPSSVTTPRGTFRFPSLSQPIALKVAPDVVNPIATIVNPLTNQYIGLPVAGDTVTISPTVLNGLANAGIATAYGSIVDATGRGYYFRLRFDLVRRTVALDIF
jgi:hypothetical protein